MENDAEVKEKSRRELLAEAWDKEEKDDEPADQKAVRDDSSATNDDSGGEKASKDSSAKSDEESAAPEKSEEDKKAEKEVDPYKKEAANAAELERKPASPPVRDRAPNSWNPVVREHWGKLPPEVRDQINKRELEIQQTLTQTGQIRKFAQDFAQVINPYQHLIRAQNSTPLQAVQNLMQTAAGLSQGTAQQRAAIVAEIINNYGIDIQALDSMLVQRYNPQQAQQNFQQNSAPPSWARPMFDFMQNVQQAQERQQQLMQQEADAEIQTFQEKPFFDDLREDMADLMEAAANRGKKMTLEQAYERALVLNPELKKIVDQRNLAASARNPVSEAAATLARARKAASTIKGAPTGTKAGAPNGKLTRRQQIAEAWDEQQT